MTVKDQQAAKAPQIIAALSATLGGFSMGTMVGWTAPIQSYVLAGGYGFHVDSTDYSFISATLPLGAMLGSFVAGPICDRIGRRTTIIAYTIPCIAGWSLVIWSVNLSMLMIGRFILGNTIGAFSCVCPLYSVEISETNIRGMLGTFFQLQVVIGILFVYIIGALTSLFWCSFICAIVPIALGVSMLIQPESPNYFLMRRRHGDARSAMERLRGPHYEVDDELAAFQKTINELEAQKLSFREAFSTRAAKRGLLIGVVLMLLQQFSGVNAVIFFSSSIFRDTGSNLDPNVCTIIMGVFNMVGTVVASVIIERAGRKPLLVISDFSMFLFTGLLGVYFFLNVNFPKVAANAFVRTLPLVSVCLFQFMSSVGFGPIPWMFIGEIFPASIKGFASSIACFVNWLSVFTVSFTYPFVNEALKPNWYYVSFFVFAIISLLGTIFVWAIVPETKGKSLEEIQRELGGIPSNSRTIKVENLW